jgi:hypothetical protein
MGSDSPSALPARVQCNKRLRQSVAQESDGFVTGGEVSGGCVIHGGRGARGLPPSALPGISPSRGEIGRRRYHRFIRKRRDRRDLSTSRSPPLRGRCPAGQRGVSPTHFGRLFQKTPKPQQLHPARRCRSGILRVHRAIARLRFGWGWCGSDALRSRVFHHAVSRKGPCTAFCEMVLSTNVASVPPPGPSLGFRHVWRPPGGTAFNLTARRGAGKSGDEFFRRQSSLRVTWRCSAARS